jgi:tetratricopeptide (TPR) repeat protein
MMRLSRTMTSARRMRKTFDRVLEMREQGAGCRPKTWSARSLRGGVAVAVALAALFVSAQRVWGQQEGIATIEGSVRDGSGAGLADASVRLQKQGDARAEERKTSTDGGFTFQELPLGIYVLSAAKGDLHSSVMVVNATVGGGRSRADFTLQNQNQGSGEESPAARQQSARDMEFADTPNFTVAGVTDWTAAGGHGSDASLRTSESLTRETLELKAKTSDNTPSNEAGDSKEMESRLRSEVERAPKDFEANHRLGMFYLRAGKFAQAIDPLENAYQIDAKDADNEYDLALALKSNGEPARAREHVQKLLAANDKADYHRLAGELDESVGDPLEAVHEFERAVRKDPSEQNYFAWGTELLLHRAVWQAKDVFTVGAKAYPKSARMLTALGAALFAGAMYDEAAKRLCEASDLSPTDPEPYLFMGKVELAAPNPLPCVEQKLARFVQRQPGNALANYYYAMTFWKQRGHATDPETLGHVETLLTKAVAIDPKCSSAYLQLGVLEASRHDFEKAIGYYNKAIEAEPQMSEAHYRLGVAYDRIGDKTRSAQEFKAHDEIEKQQAVAVDRQRREVKQFLVVVDKRAADGGSKQ